jgi:hypothetical protein
MEAANTLTEEKPARRAISEGDLSAVLDAATATMPEADAEIVANLPDDPHDLSDPELNSLQFGPDADVFDPQIHESDTYGNPVKNADGSLRRKRGRKRGIVYNGGASESAIDPADIDRAKAKAAATATVETMLAVGAMMGGEEWTPRIDRKIGLDERANLIAAYEAYFIASGTIDVPPWVGVIVATGCFALPRFAMPQTKSRLVRLREWWRDRKERKREAA